MLDHHRHGLAKLSVPLTFFPFYPAWSCAVAEYQFFCLNSVGRILNRFAGSFANDKEACARLDVFATAGTQAEVWSGSRFVGKVFTPPPAEVQASQLGSTEALRCPAGSVQCKSVKTIESEGTRGYDGGKKIKGLKQHALVDTDERALEL